MILPFTISNTLFLARMKSILVFYAMKLEALSNLFSDFIEQVMTALTRSTFEFDFDQKLKLDAYLLRVLGGALG
jgi:ATP-dependent Clp protease ATP-binding subunit ClpA